MKLLLIDDDETILESYSTALTEAGYNVIEATNGEDGVKKADSERPDLILLDQILPDAEGNQILRKLKSDELVKNIPVIVLSNFTQHALAKEALIQGALEYIYKYHVDTSDVVKKVDAVLKKTNGQ